MNNLEKMKLLNEMVALRRKVMKLDEMGEMPAQDWRSVSSSGFDDSRPAPPPGSQAQATPQMQMRCPHGMSVQQCQMCSKMMGQQPQTFKPQNPFSNQAGMQNLGGQIKESTVCSSGGGSRTGMDENAFAQDAEVSTDRKRSAEGKSESLEEGLENYYKIAGL